MCNGNGHVDVGEGEEGGARMRLVFTRTEWDNISTAWTASKTHEVTLPFDNKGGDWHHGWNLTGSEWLEDDTD